MAKHKISILVATSTLVLGRATASEEPFSLPGGEELTEDLAKKFGLKQADVKALVSGGHLAPMEVRAAAPAGGEDSVAFAAETARADAAVAQVDDLERRLTAESERADAAEESVADLTTKLADADKDGDEQEKHVETLEATIAEQAKQIEELTAQLAEATKPPAADGKKA